MNTHQTRPNRMGITLMELLVTIVIIAVLIACLLPALNGARVMAQRMQCANHMRQIGLALTMFSDTQGRFPKTAHFAADAKASWIYTLAPYLEKVDEIRLCPADPKWDERMKAKGTSYALNEYITVPGEGYVRSVHKMQEPSKSITLFTISDFAIDHHDEEEEDEHHDHEHDDDHEHGPMDHVDSREWFVNHVGNWDHICKDIQPSRFFGTNTLGSISGSANYLYADGHVDVISAETLHRWTKEGFNFARPPQ